MIEKLMRIINDKRSSRDIADENNICGRCGIQFSGIKCPQCGLVMCKNIIGEKQIKLNFLNEALNLLMDKKLIPDGVNFNDAYADFYYLLASRDDGSIIAAFKIVTTNYVFYFNYNKTLQYLKPDGKEMYEEVFNDVIKIHKITDTNSSEYRVPISDLKDFAG